MLQKVLNTLSGLYTAARVADPELYAVAACLFEPELRIEVVLFLELPPLLVAPQTVAQKFRRENPQKAKVDLLLELTSRLFALGLSFQLRSSTTLSQADGWSARIL